ncbi:MAG: TIGR02147 family protein [Bdellovibrionia bacterium]
MSVLEFDNYRLYLRSVLADRASTNPRYSLRAFAKSLELAPSYLSAVMNGKKSLSPETAYAVAEKLRLDEQEATYFRILAQMEATKNPALKESLLQRAQTLAPSVVVNDLSVDQFKMISDWHHYAIFAAVDLSDIEATPERIAKILGLNLAEVQVAVERMIRLEMLEKDAEGRLKQTISHSRIVSLAPNRAVRSHHRQNLEKAIESIGLQRPDERFMGSETFCIDESQFEEFQKLCNQFLDSALALAKKAKTKNQVYHLGVQFFRFSQEKPKEEKK